jgi:hypothetical protein
MTMRCARCGEESDVTMPGAALQPMLDELAYSNPETMQEALRPGEKELVLCRANVGGLAGTDQRLILVKKGQVQEYEYTDVTDITIEKVGWFLDAVFQLVTPRTPHATMKSKAADAAPNAFSLIRSYLPVFESAKSRIMQIRDARKCKHCGAFVPIASFEWTDPRPMLLEPIPQGGAGVLATNLLPNERILAQGHGARYYKTAIVTDQRVIFVLGRSDKRFSAFPFAALDGVEVDDRGLYLRVKGKRFEKREGVALVTSDSGMPANAEDLPKLQIIAGAIDQMLPAHTSSAGAVS